jgi:hypothetical protein
MIRVILYHDPFAGELRLEGAPGARVLSISSARGPADRYRIALESGEDGAFAWLPLTAPAAVAARSLGLAWVRDQAGRHGGGDPFPATGRTERGGHITERFRIDEDLIAAIAAMSELEARQAAERAALSGALRTRGRS